MKGVKEYFSSVIFCLRYAFKFVPWLTVGLALFFMFASIIPYGSSYILGKLVDSIATSSATEITAEVAKLLVLFAALNTIPHLLSNLRRYVLRHWRLGFSRETELSILESREKIDIAHLENPAFQDLIQRAFRQGYGPIYNLTEGQFNFLWNLTSFAFGTILAVHFSPLVYIVVIVAAMPGFLVDIKFASRGWTIWAKDSPEQRRFQDLRNHMGGRVALSETKLLQSGPKLMQWMRQILVDFSKKQLGNERFRFWAATLTDVLAFVGFAAGLFLVVKDVIGGTQEVGSVVYMLGVLAGVRNSINSLLNDISVHYEDALIVGDIKSIIETKPLVIDSPKPVRFSLDTAPEIVFENVSFKYSKSEKYVLKNLNLSFNKGNKIGLVGNNGAGKTTFVKLLCRIYDPTEGRILVNGIDLKDISIQEWWSNLGVMFQDYTTYHFRAKEAISIGRPDHKLDMERVRSASEISQASSFIEEWKDKYDQQIGVEFKGVEPSKGQRQKLAIARVVYRRPYLMILDEPTASVDAESEAKIFDSLENLSKDTTALLISHDFSTISECNQIFVLEKGELVESGTHEELMEKKGKYSELYNLQAERFKK